MLCMYYRFGLERPSVCVSVWQMRFRPRCLQTAPSFLPPFVLCHSRNFFLWAAAAAAASDAASALSIHSKEELKEERQAKLGY